MARVSRIDEIRALLARTVTRVVAYVSRVLDHRPILADPGTLSSHVVSSLVLRSRLKSVFMSTATLGEPRLIYPA